MIRRIYEIDPLVCPSCGTEMKVIAFIAGLMWTVVGTALAGVGARWLWRSPSWTAPLLVISTVDAIPIAPLREFFRTNRVRVTD